MSCTFIATHFNEQQFKVKPNVDRNTISGLGVAVAIPNVGMHVTKLKELVIHRSS